MAEEETQVEEEKTDTVEELAKQLKELKENSVSKQDYEKLKKDNKELIRQFSEERPVVKEEQEVVIKETDEQKYEKLKSNSRRMVNEDLNGLEYAELLVENTDLEKELGINVFPGGDEEKDAVKNKNDRTVEFLRQIIKDADGDLDLFNTLMNSRTTDK